MIPGIVGESRCKYSNLKTYLIARDKDIKMEIEQV